MPDDIRRSIQNLVDYLWMEEEKDYCEQLPEDREHHIFTHVMRVNKWLDEVKDLNLISYYPE